MKNYLWMLILAMGLFFHSIVKAVDTEELETICTAKANIAGYAMLYRDENTLDEMLAFVDEDWKTYKKDPAFEYHVLVDMRRVVYDAYRVKQSGGWRLPNNSDEDLADFVNREVLACAKQGF
jgi:hypothetical protein